MREITAYLYDDDDFELEAHKIAIEKMFASQNVPIKVYPKKFGVDTSNVEKSLKDRPELIFMDNHVGEKVVEKRFGQTTIAELKEKFPDCIFILLTKNQIEAESLHTKFPQADYFFQKHGMEVAHEEYAKWVVNELCVSCERARVDTINYDRLKKAFGGLRNRPKKGNNKRPINEPEIRSIIEQVCFTGGPPQDNVIESVFLKPLTGGKSEAVVAVIYIQNLYGDSNVPAVIKFMSYKAAKQEAHNHAKFVKWVLPYRWRVDVIGKGFTGDFGAVCYSFAHGGAGEPETITDLLQNNDLDRIRSVMSEVFDPKSQAWYSKSRTDPTALAVSLSRTEPYFSAGPDNAKREQLILDQIDFILSENRVEKIHDDTLKIGKYYFNLRRILNDILENRQIKLTEECLSHGDLNSSNILVRSGSSEFCFIDFQHTGYHHIAKDFCSLEGSIRTLQYGPKEVSFAQRMQNEINAWNRCELRKFDHSEPSQLIDELRSHYFANHPSSSALELAIANIIHTLWLLSLSIWNEYSRRRLIAFFFATLHCIQEKKVTTKVIK